VTVTISSMPSHISDVLTLPHHSLSRHYPDILELYLHRGSFETVLADEDQEQDADRWYSHTPCGQEFAQILAQWIWNLRLELGQQLSPAEVRTTEFAPAAAREAPATDLPEPAEAPPPAIVYGPPQWARPSFTHGFPGSAFTPQPGGTLRCPANHPLYLQERRPERDGSFESCMPRVLVIVVPARCGRSVRRAAPRSSHGG
jgi:hypothetical protein